eukprot:UN10873
MTLPLLELYHPGHYISNREMGLFCLPTHNEPIEVLKKCTPLDIKKISHHGFMEIFGITDDNMCVRMHKNTDR